MYSTTGIDASNFVSTFNTSFYFIAGISLVLLTGLTIVMLYFVFRYNNKKNKVAIQNEGNIRLEILWTVIPILLAIAMFYYGWAGWKPMNKPPANALNVTTTARMWSFSFLYENGKESTDLVLPINTPVKINLLSLDVIHSLFIPAFRIKSDIVPGRKKVMWFIPQTEGEYDLYCAEYCGLRHSYMKAVVKVLPKDKFAAWYGDTSSVANSAEASTSASQGLAIMKIQGCIACHSSDGSKIVGPSYLNLFGTKQVVIRDGVEMTVTVDEAFIKQRILDPAFQVVKGYPKGLMQSYKGKISDADIAKIIEYIKSLNEK
jgi:cytochrome c oxidase subunit II